MKGIIYLAINSRKEYILGKAGENELRKGGLVVPPDFAVLHTIPSNKVEEALRYLNMLLAPYYTGEGVFSFPGREIRMLTNLTGLEY